MARSEEFPPSIVSTVLTALLSLSALLALGHCAKRMPPPSPDRFPPRLELIRTRGRTGIELQFDEPVDVPGLPVESLSIISPDGSGLPLRGLTSGRGRDRVLIWTVPQEPVVYHLTGLIPDLAGNVARIRTRFRGGAEADTILPRITSVRPAWGRTDYLADEVHFEFSKPMDTTVAATLVTLPAALETLLVRSWDPGWQRLTLHRPAGRKETAEPGVQLPESGPAVGKDQGAHRPPAVTMPENQEQEVENSEAPDWQKAATGPPLVHIALLPGLTDLEGNTTRRIAATSFTRDSVFPGTEVAGQVIGEPAVLAIPALVFMLADTAVALAVTDEDGVFRVRVPPGTYEAVALSDTSGDGRADFVGRTPRFTVGLDTLVVELRPETTPRAVGEYRR